MAKIVLAHGLGGGFWSPFARRAFARDSVLPREQQVFVPTVPPYQSIEQRSRLLEEQVDRWVEQTRCGGTQPVAIHFIGHSMGGLDCRSMIHRRSKTENSTPHNWQARSLTTICTPHRGSSFADFLCRQPGLGLLTRYEYFAGGKQLTQEHMQGTFNSTCFDVAGCHYFSIAAKLAGVNPLHPLYLPWRYIADVEGENDGLVSEESATWGTKLATFEGIDHIAQLGWSLQSDPPAAQMYRLIDSTLQQLDAS